MFIAEDGRLYTWGANENMQLGSVPRTGEATLAAFVLPVAPADDNATTERAVVDYQLTGAQTTEHAVGPVERVALNEHNSVAVNSARSLYTVHELQG